MGYRQRRDRRDSFSIIAPHLKKRPVCERRRAAPPASGAHAPVTADDGMTPSRLVAACPAGMLREGRLGQGKGGRAGWRPSPESSHVKVLKKKWRGYPTNILAAQLL